MEQTNQNNEENFIQILKNLERATPNPNLFTKILEEVNVYSKRITSFQLGMAAAAAVLLIITNAYLIFGLDTDKNIQNENTVELISNFNIYE